MNLINIMNKTYTIFRASEALNKVDDFKEYFAAILKQTIECAYFIRDYNKDRFCA